MKEEESTKEPSESRAMRIIRMLKELAALRPKIRAAKRGLAACKPSRMEKRSACLAAKAEAAARAAADAKAAADERAAADAATEAETYKKRAVAAMHRNTAMYKDRLDSLRSTRSALIASIHALIDSTSGYRRSERREIRKLSKAVGIYFW